MTESAVRGCVRAWLSIAAAVLWLLGCTAQVQADDGASPAVERRLVTPNGPAETKRQASPDLGGLRLGSGSLQGEPIYDMSAFMKDVHHRILANWEPPEEFDWSKKIVVSFKIDPHAQLSDVSLETSCGTKLFDEAAVAAVRRAAPFARPPRDSSAVKIWFTFDEKLMKEWRQKHLQDLPVREREAGNSAVKVRL